MDRAVPARPLGSRVRRLIGWRLVLGGSLVLVILGSVACASFRRSGRPAPGSDARATEAPPIYARDPDVITAGELAEINVGNAYEAVQRLRPLWLQTRGKRSGRGSFTTEIAVALDGRYFGSVTNLKLVEMQAVKELRHIDGAEASATLIGLGERSVEAAILVVLR